MLVNSVKSLLPLFLFLLLKPITTSSSPSPYLSPSTFITDYHHMLRSFKIFIYNKTLTRPYSSATENLFYKSLLRSSFVTHSPDDAHLFFVPFSSSLSQRSIARLIRSLRADLPYWNRTLGADHFYLSCAGLAFNSDRNLLELKKNSVQVTCFPAAPDRFVPHKDVTLVPSARAPEAVTKAVEAVTSAGGERLALGFVRFGAVKDPRVLEELGKDSISLVESEPSDHMTWLDRMRTSEFCLFEYGEGDPSGVSDAVRFGCVPVVITDRPMQDLPLLDVLRWQEIGAFVGRDGVRRALGELATEEGRAERMRGLGADASKHLLWNEVPQPLDAFHTVMYQLWLRRHTIRYSRRFDLVR